MPPRPRGSAKKLRTLRPLAPRVQAGQVGLRVGSLLLVLLLGQGCGDRPAAEPTPPEGIHLTRVGTLGPVPRGPGTIVVDVTAEGRISVDGSKVDGLLGLRDRLVDLTRVDADWMRSHTADGRSRKVVRLNLDSALPFSAASWVLWVLHEPTVRIDQVFLGARAEQDAAYGSLRIVLPSDTRGPNPSRDPPPRVLLHVEPFDGEATRPESILPALRATWGTGSPSETHLVLHLHLEQRALPTGFVVQILDVALRAGVGRVSFGGIPFPTTFDPRGAGAFEERAAGDRARMGQPRMRSEDGVLAEAPDPSNVPAPRGLTSPSDAGPALQVDWIFRLIEDEDGDDGER